MRRSGGSNTVSTTIVLTGGINMPRRSGTIADRSGIPARRPLAPAAAAMAGEHVLMIAPIENHLAVILQRRHPAIGWTLRYSGARISGAPSLNNTSS